MAVASLARYGCSALGVGESFYCYSDFWRDRPPDQRDLYTAVESFILPWLPVVLSFLPLFLAYAAIDVEIYVTTAAWSGN